MQQLSLYDMRKDIERIIQTLENEHNVKIIWTGFYGSKLKGYFNSNTSDVDLAFICLPKNPLFTYLTEVNKSYIRTGKDGIYEWELVDLRDVIARYKSGVCKNFEIYTQSPLLDSENDNALLTLLESVHILAYDPEKIYSAFKAQANNAIKTYQEKPVKRLLQTAYFYLNALRIVEGWDILNNLNSLITVNCNTKDGEFFSFLMNLSEIRTRRVKGVEIDLDQVANSISYLENALRSLPKSSSFCNENKQSKQAEIDKLLFNYLLDVVGSDILDKVKLK